MIVAAGGLREALAGGLGPLLTFRGYPLPNRAPLHYKETLASPPCGGIPLGGSGSPPPRVPASARPGWSRATPPRPWSFDSSAQQGWYAHGQDTGDR